MLCHAGRPSSGRSQQKEAELGGVAGRILGLQLSHEGVRRPVTAVVAASATCNAACCATRSPRSKLLQQASPLPRGDRNAAIDNSTTALQFPPQWQQIVP